MAKKLAMQTSTKIATKFFTRPVPQPSNHSESTLVGWHDQHHLGTLGLIVFHTLWG